MPGRDHSVAVQNLRLQHPQLLAESSEARACNIGQPFVACMSGQVVLLSGEGGIGISRLTAALLESLATEPHMRLRYFCSSQHTDSAFYPIIIQMKRAAALADDNTPQQKLDKLASLLAQTSTSGQDAALLAEMLSLPNDGRYPALDLTPEQRRQRTLEALVSQMEALAHQNPLLMVFEDAHWTGPTSLEVLGRIVDRAATFSERILDHLVYGNKQGLRYGEAESLCSLEIDD